MKYSWLLLLLAVACANPIPPTGGPKDLDPPVIINTEPTNKILNFDGSEISLEFDEYIKEENLLTQLMITPNLKSPYKYKVNKNKITLTFGEPFDSATTYTLNFREGVKDITEGNVPPNLKFVFSTGDFLDSASIGGTVTSLMTKEPLEDITISLFVHPDTVDVFTGPPRYSTKSDKEGNYIIENIKNDDYLVYAIDDQNRNLKLESRTEGYGFLSAPLTLNDSITSIDLQIYKLDTRPIVLQNSRPVGNNYDLKFNKSLSNYQLDQTSAKLKSNLTENNQTVRIYYSDEVVDSLAVPFQVTDSLNQSLDSLVYVKFEESSRKPEEFSNQVSLKNGSVNQLWETQLTFNKPIASLNYDSIYFQFDSLYYIPLTDSLVEANVNKDEFRIQFDFKSYLPNDSIFSNWSNKFEFIIAPGAIISIENDSIPRVIREYSFKNPKEFGIIRGNANTEYTSYVIQLLDNSFELVEEIESTNMNGNAYEFLHISPGSYSIRVLIDANNNGIWEAGNILNLEPAEPVELFFHPNTNNKKINLRANWEQTGLDIVF